MKLELLTTGFDKKKTQMTYFEVDGIIRKYIPDLIPYFADFWNRWPEGRYAVILSDALKMQAAYWKKAGKINNADECSKAAESIFQHIQ